MDLPTAFFDHFISNSSKQYEPTFDVLITDAYNSEKIDFIKDGHSKVPLTKTWLSGFLYLLFTTPVSEEKNITFGEIYYETERLILFILGNELMESQYFSFAAPKLYIYVFSVVENTRPFPNIDEKIYERMMSHLDMANRETLMQEAMSRVRFVTFRTRTNGRKVFETFEMPVTVSDQRRLVNVKSCRIEPAKGEGP